jgi:hypothetical protein
LTRIKPRKSNMLEIEPRMKHGLNTDGSEIQSPFPRYKPNPISVSSVFNPWPQNPREHEARTPQAAPTSSPSWEGRV